MRKFQHHDIICKRFKRAKKNIVMDYEGEGDGEEKKKN